MDDIDETRSLISPKKRPARRSLSAQQGNGGGAGGAGSKFFNQYRLLMDANKRSAVGSTSLVSNKLSNQRNSIGAELNSLKPRDAFDQNRASSSHDFRYSREQVPPKLLSPTIDRSLDVIGPLSTSTSTPIGFGELVGIREKSANNENASYPLISYLDRDGLVANRKLSFDSACRGGRRVAPKDRRQRANFINGSMDLHVPIRWSARSRTVSVVGELPNLSSSMKRGHKTSAPATVTGQVHPAVQVRVSSGGGSSPINDPQQNPLWNVSNEYMKVSGYASPFNKLLSIKRKKGAVSEQQADLEKGVVENNKNDANDPSKTGPEANNVEIKQPKSVYGRLYTMPVNQKQLFKKRKDLFGKRLFVCNLTLMFAVVGIILAIVDSELSASGIIIKTGFASCFIRGVIVATTTILLILLTWYHAIEIKISVIDCGASDWRVALTWDRVFQMVFELALCSICPVPLNFLIPSVVLEEDHRQFHMVPVPLDALLSLPMFLRLYLIGRVMALHSDQFKDAATRSIARLNRVTVNFAFVMKTLMVEHPLRVLFTFTVVFWLVISWILVQCERYDGVPEQNYYLNAVWFTIITFMSIGYGDVVPNTYCGRVVAITTGIVGAGVSSALIAVMSLKLELSRAEKHVNNFMTDTKLSRQRKDAAATVLQHTWFIHKYRALQRAQDEIKLRFHQRKFLAAINEFRRIKWEQRKLSEQGNALVDVAKLQSDMHTTLWEMQQTQDQLANQLSTLTQRVQEMYDAIIMQNVARNVLPTPTGNFLTPASSLFIASPNFQQGQLLSPPSFTPNTPNTECTVPVETSN